MSLLLISIKSFFLGDPVHSCRCLQPNLHIGHDTNLNSDWFGWPQSFKSKSIPSIAQFWSWIIWWRDHRRFCVLLTIFSILFLLKVCHLKYKYQKVCSQRYGTSSLFINIKKSCVLWSSCDSSCSQGHVTLWRHSWQGYEWRRSSERFLNPRAAALSQAFALNCGIFTQINRPFVKMHLLPWAENFWGQIVYGFSLNSKPWSTLVF